MDALFESPLGAAFARPWVDRAGLFGMRRWYMPLSRLWAAANAAGDDVERFRSEIGAPLAGFWPAPFLKGTLGSNRRIRDAAEVARRKWEGAIFAGATADEASALDWRRRVAATRHMATRARFYPLLFPRNPPPARWEIDDPAAIEEALVALVDRPGELYSSDIDVASIEVSAPAVKDGLCQYWLRAPTPSARLRGRPGSETMYARVIEQADGSADATLLFGSGLGLEFELLAVTRDPGGRLARQGWRVIEPISPYHGLRAMPGRYGGEPFIAAGPTSSIDLISGQAIESALLIAWARQRFGTKVALSGISMTSFVAQQAASHCHLWPEAARPDAVMLISHSGNIAGVTFGGELAAMLGLDRALSGAGWSPERIAKVSVLIDPAEQPALPAGRIVSVLGERDRWLPYEDGLGIARRWNLPEANIFQYRLGHLGMPVQLTRDNAPFERLRRVLDAD
jgi:hypothetical protein